jgi:hypothetical protein
VTLQQPPILENVVLSLLLQRKEVKVAAAEVRKKNLRRLKKLKKQTLLIDIKKSMIL